MYKNLIVYFNVDINKVLIVFIRHRFYSTVTFGFYHYKSN